MTPRRKVPCIRVARLELRQALAKGQECAHAAQPPHNHYFAPHTNILKYWFFASMDGRFSWKV